MNNLLSLRNLAEDAEKIDQFVKSIPDVVYSQKGFKRNFRNLKNASEKYDKIYSMIDHGVNKIQAERKSINYDFRNEHRVIRGIYKALLMFTQDLKHLIPKVQNHPDFIQMEKLLSEALKEKPDNCQA